MEEGEGEDDGAADDVEPGVHRVQHLLKGRAGKKGVIWCIAMVSKGHQKICAQKPTFVKIRFQKGSPETCQGALGRAVVVGVVREEGQVLAVEGELAGVVEEAVGSHQSTWERRKVKKRGATEFLSKKGTHKISLVEKAIGRSTHRWPA